MEQLIQFIENLSIDGKLYWRLMAEDPHHPGTEVEVYWQRDKGPNSWAVRRTESGPWSKMSSDHVLVHLEGLRVVRQDLEQKLQATIMSQAALAQIVLAHAAQIIGEEALTNGLNATQDFLSQLEAKAQELAGGGSSLSVVAGDE